MMSQALEQYPRKRLVVAAVVLAALLVRYCVSLHPYSGHATPPMYGDYEAQRHWMEVTTALPVGDWYRNTTDNDLLYWGLDYPPLTAYVSWGFGKLAQRVVPELVELQTSRGIETPATKLFMRLSVLLCDAVIFIPAVLAFFRLKQQNAGAAPWTLYITAVTLVLLQPGFILIDHGHFQYNCFALGATLWAVHLLVTDHIYASAIAFSVALNFKQMCLYYSPFFAFAILHRCFVGRAWGSGFGRFFGVAFVTLSTFGVMWAPFCLWSGPVTCSQGLLAVVQRLFPFGRGLFEDKVANIWCMIDIALKLRTKLPQQLLIRLASLCTAALFAPVCLLLLLRRHDTKALLYAMCNVALSFFLGSYQVHEKSILLPLLPAALLAMEDPIFSTSFGLVSVFSMWPLLRRDGQTITYIALMALFAGLTLPRAWQHATTWLKRACLAAAVVGPLVIHVLIVNLPASLLARYPDLASVTVCAFGCAWFCVSWLYTLIAQWIAVTPVKQKEKQT